MIESIPGLDGLPFWIPSAPNLVTHELREGRQWEPYLSALYPIACPGGWTIEVGAYCGEHTIEILKYGKVAAFEPQAIPYSCLVVNLTLRAADGWEAQRRGLYDGLRTRLSLQTHPEYGVAHPSSDYVPLDTGEAADAIDKIWNQRRVSLLKIDAQGCDLPILHGAEAIIRYHRPLIVCEFEPALAEQHGHTAADYRGWFAQHGYEIRGFPGNNILGWWRDDARGLRCCEALTAQGIELTT
ncbi:MAG: FkbM family methyltransferase [Patescibacteria group bacterium]|nr:FkbM family methyltransferase [Patescibacteria group bacterium]